MITKKVNRYYCEFCNKSGGSAGHMKSHERHCTMNPNRECRMCGILGNERPNLMSLIGLLPNIEDYKEIKNNDYGIGEYISYGNLEKELDKTLPFLREKSGDCPCCMLASIRQSKIPAYLVKDFNFKTECQAIFAEKNQEHNEVYY